MSKQFSLCSSNLNINTILFLCHVLKPLISVDNFCITVKHTSKGKCSFYNLYNRNSQTRAVLEINSYKVL